MGTRHLPIFTLALAISLAWAGSPATARATEPPGRVGGQAAGQADARRRAAAAFDEGVARYARAEFAEAARAFLEADRLSPSAVAVSNILAAAKRAGDHLLVARTAEAAIARGDAVVEARAALADAATRLARIEVLCEASPCAMALDGEATSGASYVLPGTHRIEARGPAGAVAEERVVCGAGATYRISLHPVAAAGGASAGGRARIPPGVFIAGVGVTVVLGAVTVWSGLGALSAKRALPPVATQQQENAVLDLAYRTDFLLLGAGLAGVATAVVAAFTDWHGRAAGKDGGAPAPAAFVAPIPGGAAAGARWAF